ncbi:MAG: hypothetical protein ACYTDY_09485 [Planctomycetota bacterium]|jgi:hypothetical protein
MNVKLVSLAIVAALFLPVLDWPALAQDEPADPSREEDKKEGEKKEGEKKEDEKKEDEKKEKPKAPEMDDLSRKTLETYRKIAYHPGLAGVKKASFAIEVKIDSPMGAQQTKGTYKWDGQKGSLEWDDAGMGAMLGQRGIDKEQFDSDFDENAHLTMLAGAKLTAKQKDDGKILVTVEGKTKANIKSFLFGKNGLVEQLVVSADTGMGTKQDLTMHFAYRKEGDKHLETGQSFELEMGGMGKMSVKREKTYEKVSGFWLLKKIVSQTKMGEQAMGGMTLELTEWKLNDDVK